MITHGAHPTGPRAKTDQGRVMEVGLSDAQYRDLFAEIREGFFVGEIVRNSGRVVDFVLLQVNAAFSREMNRAPQEIVGGRICEIIAGFPPDVVDRCGAAVEHGKPVAFEVEVPALEQRAYEWRIHPLGGERFAGLLLEITARKRAEKTLEQSHASLSEIVDSVDQMIWSTRPDGYHDFFNRRWYEYTGMPPGATDGDAWACLLHPDDRAATFERWQRSLATGEPYEIEYRLKRRDEAYRWVLGRAHPVRNHGGEIVRWMGTCTDIDDTRRVKEALRASEERFRALYEAQQTAHLVLSPDLMIEDASPAYLEATMTRRHDLIGKHLFEAFPENPANLGATGMHNVDVSLRRVLQHGVPDRMSVHRYDIRRPSGEYETRWWAPLNVPVFGDDGSVRHIIHQVEDVTAEMIERQKAAEAEARETRLREVANAIPGLVFETDLEARNTYVNEQYRVYTGLAFEALLGEGWQKVLHPDDRARLMARWNESLRSGRAFEMECRIRRADGVWRWFMVRTTALRDAQGRAERTIGVCTDIDDARRAQDALRESEQQFRSLAESLPQLAWMADAKGWIYWYNKRWYDYTGTTLEEMQGWGWRKIHHPDYVEGVVERLQRAWNTGEPWEDVFPLRGADGRYRWFLSRAMPLRDAEGRVIRWFGTNTDITEKQKLEDLQRTLIHEISHRVKNSLTLVSSLLTLQARSLQETSRKALMDAATRVHIMARVHDQLSHQADAREIDLGPFIENLATAIADTAPSHNTIIQADTSIVSADVAGPLGLLLNELLTNAYKHAYPEGVGGDVRVQGTRIDDGRYRLCVADSGRGLPPDFDPAKARDSLGMRVLTSLSGQIHGALEAASTNPGARFTLTFPLEPAAKLPSPDANRRF